MQERDELGKGEGESEWGAEGGRGRESGAGERETGGEGEAVQDICMERLRHRCIVLINPPILSSKDGEWGVGLPGTSWKQQGATNSTKSSTRNKYNRNGIGRKN